MTRVLLFLCVLLASPAWAVTLPTLPTATVDVTMPTITGSTLSATCATLQAQLNAAAALSTSLNHQVTLATGTTCTGPFVLPAHAGPGWVVITGPNGGVVASGTRVGPSNAASMPQVMYGENASHSGSFSAATNATHYRIVGIDMVENVTCSGCAVGTTNYASVYMGYGNGGYTGTGYIIVDRSLIRDRTVGHYKIRGVSLDAQLGNTAMIDSYCSGVKEPDNDTQCALAVSNPGPVLIRNNYLEATGENAMIGGGEPGTGYSDADISLVNDTIIIRGAPATHFATGTRFTTKVSTATSLPAPLSAGTVYYAIYQGTSGGDTTIKIATSAANASAGTAIDITDLGLDASIPTPQPCTGGVCKFSIRPETMIPADVTITLNTFAKDTSLTGATYHQIKSLIETKLGKRVSITGNDFLNQDYNGGGQIWRMTVRNETGTFPFAELSDVTFSHNKISNSCGGISGFGSDDGGGGGQSKVVNRVNISNNLWILGSLCSGFANATLFQLAVGGGAINGAGVDCTSPVDTCKLHDLTIRHNTVDLGTSGTSIICVMSAGQKLMDFKDNLIDASGGAGVLDCNGALTGSRGTAILDIAWGAGGYSWTGNGISDISVGGEGSGIYPQTGNTYWANSSSILWTNPATADYTLQAGSPAKLAASDGTDMGVNFTNFNIARAGSSSSSGPTGALGGAISLFGGVRSY